MPRHRKIEIAFIVLSVQLGLNLSANVNGTESDRQPIEVAVWPGVAPGSEGVTEEEIVVERGDGVNVIDRSIQHVHRPTLTVHLPKQAASTPSKPTPAMVICPGGGLTRVVIDKEGHALARFLAARGVAGIVLKFRTAKSPATHYGVEPALADLQQSMRLVRSRCNEWNIDPERVGVFGFSAGGILASALTVHHDTGDPMSEDEVAQQSCRPDFVAMAYPITTLDPDVNGRYSGLMLRNQPTPEGLARFACDKHIGPTSPPMFLCHAEDDKGVPVANSLRMQKACQAAGVPCTLVTAPSGGHGFGLRKTGTSIDRWPGVFETWLLEVTGR